MNRIMPGKSTVKNYQQRISLPEFPGWGVCHSWSTPFFLFCTQESGLWQNVTVAFPTAVCASLHLFSSCLFREQAAPMNCLTGLFLTIQNRQASCSPMLMRKEWLWIECWIKQILVIENQYFSQAAICRCLAADRWCSSWALRMRCWDTAGN